MNADNETRDLQIEFASPQPVSVIVGDRLCMHCGYNLTGQSIFREQHYHLLIARCPECGSVTSLQDYPSLGRWANRWAGVLAGLWVLLLLAAWAVSSSALFGISLATAETSGEQFRSFVDEQYLDWQAQQEALAAKSLSTSPTASNNAATTQTILFPPGVPPQVQMFFGGGGQYKNFPTWWVSQDKASLLERFGGWRKVVKHKAFLFWFLITLIAFSIGCFWGIALLKQRRRGLLIWASLLFATSCVFSIFPIVDWYASEPNYPWSASQQVIAPPILLISLAYAVIPLFSGVMLGRPIARKLTRILLPPGLLNTVSTLWITDGMKPPSV